MRLQIYMTPGNAPKLYCQHTVTGIFIYFVQSHAFLKSVSVIVLNVHGYTLAEQGTNVAGKSDMSQITQESSHVLFGPCLFLSHLIIVIVI